MKKQRVNDLNRLSTINPILAKEWHPTLNVLTPEQVTVGSPRQVWWRCEKGHDFNNTIAKRHSRGDGCPYCSGKRVTPENSLATKYPALAHQWNYVQNGDLTPDKVTAYSQRKVWWQCDICHQNWEATIHNRTYGDQGCPYCSNHKAYSGNSLETKRPDLASEWHPTKNIKMPKEVTEFSNQYAYWLCNRCGNEWKAVISSRSYGAGCPKCKNEHHTSFQEQAIFYYLGKIFPDIRNRYILEHNGDTYEADIYVPQLQLAIEYDGGFHAKNVVRDEKKNRAFHEMGYTLIRIRLSTLPLITAHDSIVFIHEKQESNYESLKSCILQIGKYILDNYTLDSDLTRDLKTLLNISIGNDESLIYLQYAQNEKERSLASLFPYLLKEWDYEKNVIAPDMLAAKTHRPANWICRSCGYKWNASIASRTSGRGCPRCEGKVADATNSISKTHPHLLVEWDYEKNTVLTPSTVLAGSDKYAYWICNVCKRSWKTRVKERALHNAGCPVCGKKNRKKGTRGLLKDEFPEMAAQWHPTKNQGLYINKITCGSNKKVWWICENKHEWLASVDKRTSRKSGCPTCLMEKRIQEREKHKSKK